MFSQALSQLNWLHVLVATVAFFILGALWYSPVLFAKKWTQLNAIDMSGDKKGMGAIMFASFVLMFIACTGLAGLQQVLPVADAMGGIKLGLLTGICFSATAISISYLYVKKAVALHFIDWGYQVVGMTLASFILAIWH